MASRYLSAKAIPNLGSILKITQWLNVDPGFLCFGDLTPPQASNTVKIEKDLLIYFLKKFIPITKKANNDTELIDFFVSTLLDLSALQIEKEQLKNIFEMAFKLPLAEEKIHGESNKISISSKIA